MENSPAGAILQPPIHAILNHVRGYVKDELLGVLLTGSVALGTANIYSDLDIYVIVRDRTLRRSFHRWEEMDMDVDLWTVNPDFIRSSFQGNASITYCFAVGKALFDINGVLAGLIKDARIRYSAGPTAKTSNEVTRLRHRVTTILEDCSRLRHTKSIGETHLFMYSAVFSLLRIHCGLQQIWAHDDRTLLANLQANTPAVAALAEEIILSNSVDTRAQLINELAAEVLKDVGGPLKYFDTVIEDSRRGASIDI